MCKQGILLVNMVRCIGKDDDPMIANTCYDAWLAYTLKMMQYCAEKKIPAIILCQTCENSLLLYMQKIYPMEKMEHRSILDVSGAQREMIHQIMRPWSNYIITQTHTSTQLANHTAPIQPVTSTLRPSATATTFVTRPTSNTHNTEPADANWVEDEINWETLQDYIQEMPDNISLKLGKRYNEQYFEFKSTTPINGSIVYHSPPINSMQNLIVKAIDTRDTPNSTKFINNILEKYLFQHMLYTNAKHIDNLSNHLSYVGCASVNVSGSLINLLKEAAWNGRYTQQNTVHQIGCDFEKRPRHCLVKRCHQVTDVQAILALAVVLKSYPLDWQRCFFWDAWLAVTIQLSLLKEVFRNGELRDDDSYDKCPNVFNNSEVVPCSWMHKIFQAEQLIRSPENVRGILMGLDPINKVGHYGRSVLHKTSGIAFHNVGDTNASIRGMNTKYSLNCNGDNPKNYCQTNGLLMVNMIRCIYIHDLSVTQRGNICRDAWIHYTVKLTKYMYFQNVPIVVTTKDKKKIPDVVYYMRRVNPRVEQVKHPWTLDIDDESRATFTQAFSPLGILSTQ